MKLYINSIGTFNYYNMNDLLSIIERPLITILDTSERCFSVDEHGIYVEIN